MTRYERAKNGAKVHRTNRKALRLSILATVALAATMFSCGRAETGEVGMEEEGAMDEAVMDEGLMGASEAQGLPKPAFTAVGELEQPEGYREWVYIGTPLTPNELNPPEAPFPEFHVVYIHPDDYEYWEQTGEFRDGTILVKELVSIGSKEAVSGNGYFMGDFIGLEATVKDSERFPDEPGNWAYFSFGHSYPLAAVTAAQPTANCNACHAASAADDWVFTQYYPVLRAAKGDSGM